MYKGSCLCGAVTYEIKSDLVAVTSCHCTMCQKQHGAAFATYGSVRREDFIYLSGESLLATYQSSSLISRKFCGRCGSNIEWSGSKKFPDWVSIAIATLDTPFLPKKIAEVHTESKVCWLENN